VSNRTANVVGLGLIGGSVAAGLVSRGWTVRGTDAAEDVVVEAISRGLISGGGLDPAAEVTIVAVPVSAIPAVAEELLSMTTGIVTDLGSVKGAVVRSVASPRFVGGHPMAGSELHGLAGADPDLFCGAMWVLTPTASTDDAAFQAVASLVRDLGAEPIVLDAEVHDRLVAIVSHLPHLTAAALMGVAVRRADDHGAVLRLAAGGFRDMTRVASGSPAIWIDICRENRTAIMESIDELVAALVETRQIVAEGDDIRLSASLQAAREARSNLPGRIKELRDASEVRVPIPDRAGAAAEIFAIAAETGVNVANFEVVHSTEGDRGVLVMVVEAAQRDLFRGGLLARGYRPTVTSLT
jgi:prephenate dehydrogenase